MAEFNLDDFSIVNSDSVLTPPEASIFKRTEESFEKFAQKVETGTPIEDETKKEEPLKTEPKQTNNPSEDTNNILDKITNITEEELDKQKSEVFKAKTDKSSTIDYLKEKIEAKDFVPFEDYDEKVPLDEYLAGLSKKDLHSLLDENIKIKEEIIKNKAPQELFEALFNYYDQ